VKRQVRAIGVLGASLALVIAALAACSSSSPSTPIGTVADTGFPPAQNAFSFQNSGNALSNGTAPTNLTAADVQKLFGDALCADAQSRKCDLIPEAQAQTRS
jgi:hypothetical protein